MSHLLPSTYLSVNLPIMEKTPSELTPTLLGFPNEFPYEFDSPSFSPGFTSPGDSTETEDESSDDEEDFLAGLTRRLAPSTQRLTPPLFKTEVRNFTKISSLSLIFTHTHMLTDSTVFIFCRRNVKSQLLHLSQHWVDSEAFQTLEVEALYFHLHQLQRHPSVETMLGMWFLQQLEK